MKKLTNLIKAVVALIFVGLCSIIYYHCSNKKLSPKQVKHIREADLAQINQIKQSKIDFTWHENIHDISHAEKTTAVGNSNQLKTSYKKEIKDISRNSNIRESQIDNHTSFNATSILNSESNGSFLDSLNNKILEFPIKDTCTGGYAVVDIDSMDLKIHTVSHIPIHCTLYWDKVHDIKQLIRFKFKKFFSDKIYKQDIYSECPNVVIDSIISLKVIKGF